MIATVKNKVLIAAHMGTHGGNIPGNTQAAFELALRQGADIIELDVTKSADDVVRSREQISDFAYDGALLHDIGKIFIVETIITYWRELLESEHELIRTHTIAGASLLSRFSNTAEFAELALGHHKWYDDSDGYPEDFRLADAKYPALVSLLSVADCLDAATDSIGRTYKEGKTLDEVAEDMEADRGTRYAPYAVDLIRDPKIRKELDRLLTIGRDNNYRNTYSLLKSLSLSDK